VRHRLERPVRWPWSLQAASDLDGAKRGSRSFVLCFAIFFAGGLAARICLLSVHLLKTFCAIYACLVFLLFFFAAEFSARLPGGRSQLLSVQKVCAKLPDWVVGVIPSGGWTGGLCCAGASTCGPLKLSGRIGGLRNGSRQGSAAPRVAEVTVARGSASMAGQLRFASILKSVTRPPLPRPARLASSPATVEPGPPQ